MCYVKNSSPSANLSLRWHHIKSHCVTGQSSRSKFKKEGYDRVIGAYNYYVTVVTCADTTNIIMTDIIMLILYPMHSIAFIA